MSSKPDRPLPASASPQRPRRLAASPGARRGWGAGHGPPRRALLLGEHEVEQLLAATAGERHAVRDRAVLELLYGAAIRSSEARRLRVEDLALEERAASVLGKGKRRRRVLLPARAVAAIRRHLEQSPASARRGWVFCRANGNQLSRRFFWHVVAKYSAKAGIEHASPHTLRHSAASHLLAAGAYLFAVKDVLGHAHASTTSRYLHWIDPGESTESIFHRLHPRAR